MSVPYHTKILPVNVYLNAKTLFDNGYNMFQNGHFWTSRQKKYL